MIKKEEVLKTLEEVYDPELHVDIVTLGLIYDIKIKQEDVEILMTFTFPGCPYGPNIVSEVEEILKENLKAKKVDVALTFNPPWTPDKMDKDVKAALGL